MKRRNNQSEEEFHDIWASSVKFGKINPRTQFEGPTSPEYKYSAQLLEPIKDKKILVLGCGMGEEVVYLARKGAMVHAVDISSQMLKITKKLAIKYKVQKRIVLYHSKVEDIKFPAQSFDAVFACNLLHHINIQKGLTRIVKILKIGGRCVFLEPLAYNPVINIYRRMASEVRTDSEHPITIKDLKLIEKFFPGLEHREFHLLTLLIFIWFYIGEGVHPNKERYWKKIIYESQRYKTAFNVLYKFDRILLKVFPALRWFCWVIVIDARKS